MNISFISPERIAGDNSKCGNTLVVGEFEGEAIRERLSTEPVHYRAEDDNSVCARCGCFADVWLDSEARWDMHPARCVNKAFD